MLMSHPHYDDIITIDLCEGGIYNGIAYSSDTVLVNNLTSEFGCDSIVTTQISVILQIATEENIELCYGEMYEGVGYTTSTTFTNSYITTSGCDSIVTTNINVFDEIIENINETICQGESVMVGTSVYTTSGTYTDILTNFNGCDSTVNLTLTVNPTSEEDMSEIICQGESITIGTSTYTAAGTYTDTLSTVNGCDSIINLTLAVNQAYTLGIDRTICEGESVTIGTSIYTTSGTYSDILTTINGCDSTVNLSLTVNPVYMIDTIQTICEGESVVVGSSIYTIGGTYSDVLTTANGCDSTINLTLIVNPLTTTVLEIDVCEGGEYNGVTYTSNAVLTDLYTDSNGCDSTVITNINVHPNFNEIVAIELCEGGIYNGTQYFTDTVLVNNLMSELGCDSIVTTQVSVILQVTAEENIELCYGEMYEGISYTTSTTLTNSYTSTSGCDSIVTTNINVFDEIIENINETICQGESVSVGTSVYTATGNYTDILTNANGCDSTVNLTLIVNPTSEENISEIICQGESVTIGSNTYTTTGNYTDTLSTVNGCDSIINLTLAVNQTYTLGIDRTICEGGSVSIGTSVYTTSGTYSDVLTTVNGCDSTINLSLIVNPVYTIDTTQTICEGESVVIGTNVYTTSGTYSDLLISNNGCDSTINLTLVVNLPTSSDLEIDLCSGDTYGGIAYASDTILITNHIGVNGCDSTSTINITVYPEYSEIESVSLCEGGIHNGVAYSADTILVNNLTSINGCDSIITTQIFITPDITTTETLNLCFGGVYDGFTYTSDTTWTNVYISTSGCDSIVVTDIIVEEALITNIGETICDGDSVVVGTSTYTANGNYTDILTSVNGCDSMVNLTLLVNLPTSSETNIGLCSGTDYNGVTYTSDTTLIAVYTGVNNCDSVATTNILVYPNYSDTIIVNLCEGGTHNGVVYTSDAVLIDNLTSVHNCDSTVTTLISITPEIRDTFTVDLCFGTSHEGVAYIADTTLINNYIASGGCDSIVVTHIIVGEELISNLNETICLGDSVVIGTSVYNTSGSYTDVLTSVNDCDSTVNLTLLVNMPTATEIEIDLCANVPFNGNIYLSDTTLIDTYVGSNNCDSVVTTNITVYPDYSPVFTVNLCEGEAHEGMIYNEDTTLVNNLMTINGCDSIITTQITVIPTIYDTLSVSLCYGDAYLGTPYFMDNILTDVYTATSGCDSIVTIIISVSDELMTNLNEVICEGDSIVVGTTAYTAEGNYSDVLVSSTGCDSTVNLLLTVNPTYTTDLGIVSICEGESFPVGGNEITTAGDHTISLTTINGCDSIINLSLVVNPVYDFNRSEVICEGNSVTIGGDSYTNTGIYTISLTTVDGCDSTIVLDLLVNPVYDLSIEAQICEGEEYEHGGEVYTESGTYEAVFVSSAGCDSIVSVDLNVVQVYVSTVHANICDGDSYYAGGAQQTIAGTYYDTIMNSAGCPNLLITHLAILEVFETEQDINICGGESFFVGGEEQTASGVYYDILNSANGCDSIVTTTLTVNPVYYDTIQASICQGESYFTAGAAQTTAGVYINNNQTVNGCDSITIVDLDILFVPNMSLPVTMCEGESITVNGTEYTETGVYIDSLNTTEGCDSLITYLVTVIEQYETFFDEVICEGDSIFIAGEYRYDNGEYTERLTSVNGCDSILITELFIEPSVHLTAEDVAICFGEEVQLSVEGSENVRWSPSEGLSCNDCTNPVADPRETTTYTVSAESCLGTTTETTVTVIVNNPPSLTLSTNNNVLLNQEIVLTAVSSDPNAWITWYQNGEIVCEDCTEYTAEPSLNMNYLVMVEDENGCTNSDEIDVNVNDGCSFSNFEIPNIISPNGDGYNDYFEIKYEGVNEVSLLRIYNRWGELVYETNDISKYWNGTFKGQGLNPGVYIYYLEGLCLDNEAFTKTGNVTILK